MLDISSHGITVDCPSCKRKHSATLKDVTVGRVISCSCGVNIRLADKDQSVKNGVEEVNSAMKKLTNTFKSLGR